VHRTTPTGGGQGLARYSFGTVTLGLQLDAWATFQAVRDELAGAVGAALHRHPAATLGLPPGPLGPRLGRRGGLVLPVPDLLGAPCDFRFEGTPAVPENAAGASTAEWRATWTGEAFLYLVTEEQVALLRRISLDFGDGTVRALTP
jgi:hypothetical protein